MLLEVKAGFRDKGADLRNAYFTIAQKMFINFKVYFDFKNNVSWEYFGSILAHFILKQNV